MTTKLVTLCLLVLLGVATHARGYVPADEEMEGVLELTQGTFDRHVGHDLPVFVEVYSPTCSACLAFSPDMKRLGKLVAEKGEGKFILAKVDGPSNVFIKDRFAIGSYPTLLFFPEGSDEPKEYKGARDLENICNFLNFQVDDLELVPSSTAKSLDILHASNMEHVISSAKFTTVVYITSWCTTCKDVLATLERLAFVFRDDTELLFAKFDCSRGAEEKKCEEIGVTDFPTVRIYKKNMQSSAEVGERDVKKLIQVINEEADVDRDEEGNLGHTYGVEPRLVMLVQELPTAEDKKATLQAIVERSKVSPYEGAYYEKLASGFLEKGHQFLVDQLKEYNDIFKKTTNGRVRTAARTRINIINAVLGE